MTLIPGDGIGPELTEATRRVLEATGVEFDWDVQPAGAEVMARARRQPAPGATLESIRRNGVALKGPITTPIGEGFRSVNVGLRQSLDLYAQVRPCKTYPGVRTRYDDVDLVIVRETTEDIYAGIEFEQGTPDAEELIALARGARRASCRSATPASRSSRSRSPARGACSSSPSTTRGAWAAARSRPSTRRTS